jgi:RND family efflux transporter MFP subunit
MQKITKLSLAIVLIISIASCKSDGKKDGNAAINDKKVQLEKLKGEKNKLDADILKLQEELAKIDTSSSNPAKIKLVALTPVVLQNFDHYINLQGKIDAENISYVAPRGQPGVVRALFIKQGDQVRKGQMVAKLDDAVQRQQVAVAKQQAGAINAQLTLARNIYQRTKNLWDQGIGTEVDMLSKKSQVSVLESQLASVGESVKQAQEQLNLTNVVSDVSGVADIVNIRVGETFVGAVNGIPQIKIVNNSQLKITSSIPENYLGTVNKGTQVVAEIQDSHKTINTTVSFVGASIDAINRGFVVEAKLPTDPALKPNQIAIMKIRDYSAANTVIVPLNTLQNDEKGKFVMIATTDNGKLTAHKRVVTIGKLNGDQLEITSGLKAGDQLVTEGFGSLYEGQQIKTAGN